MSTPPEPDAALPAGLPLVGGLLLVRGDAGAVEAWARHQVLDVVHAPLADGWRGVQVCGASRLLPPYDDAWLALAAARLPRTLRPAVGWFVGGGGRGALTVHRRWRGGARWGVWHPGVGLVDTPSLARAGAAEVASVCRLSVPQQRRLRRLLHEPGDDARTTWLAALDLAGLPGGSWLAGERPADAVEIPVDEARLARFNDAVRDHVDLRRELGEQL